MLLLSERLLKAAEHAVAVDRFAREIGAFLNDGSAARSRQLNGRALDCCYCLSPTK